MLTESLFSIPILMDIKGISNFIDILNNVPIHFLVKLNSIQPDSFLAASCITAKGPNMIQTTLGRK